jgi:hypothetical protein
MGTTLRDALSEMLASDYQTSCIVDEEERVRGLIDLNTIQETIQERRGRES